MDGKESSKALKWKWNHGDPMTRSPEILLEATDRQTVFFSTAGDRSTYAFTAASVNQLEPSVHDAAEHARFRGREMIEQSKVIGCAARRKKKKKKKKEKKKKCT